jgi:hypothetical protein
LQNNPGIPARHPIVMLRKSFRDLFTGLVILIFGANNVLFVYSLSQSKSCKEHPRLIGPCFNVHGRLSYYNGAPSLRLWPVGTHRLLGISEGRFALPGYDNVPSAVIARLANFENEMFADFTVCPFTTDEPGVMRLVCIETARNILVKTREQKSIAR